MDAPEVEAGPNAATGNPMLSGRTFNPSAGFTGRGIFA